MRILKYRKMSRPKVANAKRHARNAERVTMPPEDAPRSVRDTGVCFLIRLTPSTRILFRVGYATRTLPLAPLSLPEMTSTVSPLWTFI